MNFSRSILVLFVYIMMTGCTEPGETTAMGAAAGSVIGAGLGAIVGSQTGDPGSGLVIGAAAGAGTGALIGNSIQAQQEALRTQDEAIERQERVIAAQKSELMELKRMNQDSPGFKTSLNNKLKNSQAWKNYDSRNKITDSRASYKSQTAANAYSSKNIGTVSKTSFNEPVLHEKSLPVENKDSETAKTKKYSDTLFNQDTGKGNDLKSEKPALHAAKQQEIEEKLPVEEAEDEIENKKLTKEDIVSEESESDAKASLKTASVTEGVSTECQQAEQEMSKAKLASDNSDKLFHTRRAIRLCSERPSYHNTLAEIYSALNRKEDAQFEFQEALKYDPTYQAAKDGLAKISSKGSGSNSNKY